MNCPQCQLELIADGLTGLIACPECNHEFETEPGVPESDEPNSESSDAELPVAEIVEEDTDAPSPESAETFEIATAEAPLVLRRLSRGGVLTFFDLKFDRYLTPVIIRIYWAMALIFGAVVFVYLFNAFLKEMSARKPPSDAREFEFRPPFPLPSDGENWFYDGLYEIGYYLLLIVAFVAVMLFVRLMCEMVMVLFDISNSLKTMKEHKSDEK